MNPIELIDGFQHVDNKATVSGKNKGGREPDSQTTSFINEINELRIDETSVAKMTVGEPGRAEDVKLAPDAPSEDVNAGPLDRGGLVGDIENHQPLAEKVDSLVSVRGPVAILQDGAQLQKFEGGRTAHRTNVELTSGSPFEGQLMTAKEDLSVRHEAPVGNKTPVDEPHLQGLSKAIRQSAQTKLSAEGPEGSTGHVQGMGKMADRSAAALGNDDLGKIRIDTPIKIGRETSASGISGSVLGAAIGTRTPVATSPEIQQSNPDQLEQNAPLFDDEEFAGKATNFDGLKDDKPGRPSSEIRPILSSNIPSVKPALNISEQSMPMIVDAQIEDVEMISQIEVVGSKDRAFLQTASASNPLQFNPTGARHVMGQVTAGLNQLADGTVEIRLNPAELGRITIQLIEAAGGIQSASVLVEKPEVLDLLRRNENLLGAEFEQAGLGAMSFSFNQQEGTDEDPAGDGDPIALIETQNTESATIAQTQIRTRADLDIRL